MYLIYRLLTAASMLALVPYFAWRGWRRGEPRTAWRQRMGDLPEEIRAVARKAQAGNFGGPMWIHAVSVGEVLASVPLVHGIRAQFPDRVVVVSTTTETGQRLAAERLPSANGIFYFPVDWIVPVRRALEAIRPGLVIMMETEIWPNFLREARRQGVPVVVANARISERSAARFRRWRFAVNGLFASALGGVELFLAQSADDAKRLEEMGAPADRIEITGNLKYDGEPPGISAFGLWLEAQVSQQERWPVVVAGSVVAEEEQAVLEAYDLVQRQWRRALLVLAPRKPERFDVAAEIAAARGWETLRRSHANMNAPLDENAEVLVLDSIGELAGIYSLADAVFVGGSLVASGGHNILEPAWFSRPPVFGPSMENFREMANAFLEERAGIQVKNGTQLGKVWTQLIEDSKAANRMGAAARALSERNRGSTLRSLERIAAIVMRDGRPV